MTSPITSPAFDPAGRRRRDGGLARRVVCGAVFSALVALGAGCQTGLAPDALKLSPLTLEHRQLQTRKFERTSEHDILAASAGVLQDLGFNVDESETKLGVIVASKRRTAREPYFTQLLNGFSTGFFTPVPEQQKIRLFLVTRPVSESNPTAWWVRVTIERTIFDLKKRIINNEEVVQPEIYREFFNQLAKSLFLEAQKI